jgi:Raf kinase inhibitor-like YbhB/YbcL family protein
MPLTLTSSAFALGATIPTKYSCDGDAVSPPLAWSGVPAGAQSLALIADDPDAPRGVFVHWVLYNLPPTETALPEGVTAKTVLPNGACQGMNSAQRVGFTAPCPPNGTHRYYFKLYALDIMVEPAATMTKAQLEHAMAGHIIAHGEVMGRYQR